MHDVLRNSRAYFIQHTSWPAVPEGPLLIVADAVVELIEHQWYSVYLLLIRPIVGTEATLLPPLVRYGTETVLGWRVAMDTIAPSALKRIRAIVCDGHRGLVQEGMWRGWIIQRCHFHLLARIQSRRSRFQIARNNDEAEIIFTQVRTVLFSRDEAKIRASLGMLEELGWGSSSPEIRTVLSGFVTHYQDYRSYLTHPELHLPATNNSAESLASMIADLKHRMRGFPTFRSFEQWVIALLKFKQTIACNEFHQQH